jgi:hypothetical protein
MLNYVKKIFNRTPCTQRAKNYQHFFSHPCPPEGARIVVLVEIPTVPYYLNEDNLNTFQSLFA